MWRRSKERVEHLDVRTPHRSYDHRVHGAGIPKKAPVDTHNRIIAMMETGAQVIHSPVRMPLGHSSGSQSSVSSLCQRDTKAGIPKQVAYRAF